MDNKQEIKSDYLISLIGIKEVELNICRDRINQLTAALQQAQNKLKEQPNQNEAENTTK